MELKNWFKKNSNKKPMPPAISTEFQDFSKPETEKGALQVGNNPWMDKPAPAATEKAIKQNDIPVFLKRESRFYIAKITIFSILLFVSAVALTFVACAYVAKKPYIQPGYFVPCVIGTLLFLILTIVTSVKMHFWFKDMKHLKVSFNFEIAENDTRDIYARLVTSFINLNWFAFYIYLMLGFTVLITFIVFYFMGTNAALDSHDTWRPVFGSLTYGLKNNPNYNTPGVVIWSVVGIAIFTFLNQVFWQIFNLIRIKQIDSFFHKKLISHGEITQMKNYANRRDFLIFLAGTIILAFVAIIVYRVMKRK